jgi:hypothetical protein
MASDGNKFDLRSSASLLAMKLQPWENSYPANCWGSGITLR